MTLMLQADFSLCDNSESDTLHRVSTAVINLFLFSRCRAGGEKQEERGESPF